MLRTLALALLLLSISGSALAPPPPIVALAAFEVLADGFGALRGIAVDDDDRVYVADRETGTVTRVGVEGRSVIARHLERPVGLAFGLDGRLLVAEERAARVVRLDPVGPTPIVRDIKQPRWLAVSERGTVYISARRLTRGAEPEPDDESAEPEVILSLATDGTLAVFADGFDHLQGLATHHDTVYAVTTGRRGPPRQDGVVFRIPVLPDGKAGAIVPITPRDAFERPSGLTIDRLGALYFSAPGASIAGQRARQAVVKLAPDGALATFAANLDNPRGLAFDTHGHLYVADGNGGRVLRFLAPAAPALIGGPRFTNQPVVTIAGTTVPNARLDLFLNDGGVPVASVLAPVGTFSAGVAVTANIDNRLEVFATAARGNGLSSPAAETVVSHDAVAPSLAWQMPPAGTFVRGTVPVHVDAADRGSQLATLSLTASGRPLGAMIVPALPGPVATVSAAWDTTTVADGTQTVAAVATDRAGNAVTVSRAVIIDNTPPETEITGGPSATTTQPAVAFTFGGRDNLTPSASLQFAWRLDEGPLSAFGADTSVTLPAPPPGDHVFEVFARDLAGNVDLTPARQAFTVESASLAIAITAPATGTSAPTGVLLVQGTFGVAPGVGVSVNGFPARVHAAQWAVEIPITPGDNVVTAVARAVSGGERTDTISVTGIASPPALLLRAEPASGVAPLHVTWRLASRVPRPLVRFELDALGNGVFDAAVTTLDGTETLYDVAGLRFPTVRATDDQGNVYLARTIFQADDVGVATAKFQAVWSGFKARLQAGDRAGALSHLSPALQARFEPILQQLAADLPAIAAGFGAVELIDQVDTLAEAAIIQLEDGASRLYFIYFRLDNRGQWLIQEM
jgi:sugar lactone lactonase YvrE